MQSAIEKLKWEKKGASKRGRRAVDGGESRVSKEEEVGGSADRE